MKQLAVALLTVLWGISGAFADNAPAVVFPSGESIFATTFSGLDGGSITPADFKGKPLVLNFWATWCPPCREEIPELVAIHNRYAVRGMVLIGVAVEEVGRVSEFVKANNMPYRIAIGREKGIWLLQTLGNKAAGLPYTVVLDRDGRIVFTKRGALTRERLEQVLEPLL